MANGQKEVPLNSRESRLHVRGEGKALSERYLVHGRKYKGFPEPGR